MPTSRTINAGEGISNLAAETGHFALTIWNHPQNASLRAKREHLNVLAPGDVVYIPDLQPSQFSGAADNRHRFRRKGIPPVLRLQVYIGAKPRANQNYNLEVDGAPLAKGVTDGDGVLQAFVPVGAQTGLLTIGPDKMLVELSFQNLLPVHLTEGLQMRLQNLGYYRGPVTGVEDEATQAAISRFQKDAGLPDTGTGDAATLAKLLAIHDQVSPHPAASRPENA
jgi:hypothetical protein